MAKFVHDTVMDAALDEIKNNATDMIICEGQPVDYTAATTLKSGAGNKLGETTVAAGDFTKADGDVDGRKLIVAAQSAVPIAESGSWDHVAIVDDTGTRLLLVTTLPAAETVSNGNNVDVNSFDHEIGDAS